MKTHFNVPPEEYERLREGHMYRRRESIVESSVASRVPASGTVVEIGCGTGATLGRLAARFPNVHLVGLDVDPEMIEYAERTHAGANIRFSVADFPHGDAGLTADLLFSVDVLHHVHDLDAFVAGARRVLAPGGAWLMIEPNVFHPYIWLSQERMRRAGFDEDHFRPWVVEPRLRSHGFEIEEKRYAFVFPGGVQRLPRPLAWLESGLERFRFTGGSVLYLASARR